LEIEFMTLLNSQVKAAAIGFALLAGITAAPGIASAQQPGQGVLKDGTGCEPQYLSKNPVLCKALSDLYRVRASLQAGDEATKDRTNRTPSRASYTTRRQAIQNLDAAIRSVRSTILIDAQNGQ
jgi:hypothetical protein